MSRIPVLFLTVFITTQLYAAIIRDGGFQTPVIWNGKSEATGLPGRIRLRVTFEGERKTDIRFSAIYIR